MKTLALFAALLFTHQAHAAANPARQALLAVSQTQIDADLAAAMTDSGYKLEPGPYTADLDYTLCVSNQDCFRYVLFEGAESNVVGDNIISFVVSYQSSVNQGKATDVSTDSSVQHGRLDVDGYADVVKRLIPTFEKDYESFPAKGQPAYHPFSIKISETVSLSNFGENEPHPSTSSNLVVNFSESTYSRVAGATNALTYLVRVKYVDDKLTKMQVKRLKMDKLL